MFRFHLGPMPRRMMLLHAMNAAMLCCVVGCQDNPSLTVAVPQAVVQEGVNLYFPVTSKELLGKETPVDITLKDATVLMKKGRDQIGLKFNVMLTENFTRTELPPPPEGFSPAISHIAPSGSFSVWGKILYRPENASFYLIEPTFEDISLAALPDRFHEPTMKAVEQMLANYLRENSIYTLSDANSKTKTAKMVLKSLEVKDGTLSVELGP